MDLQDFTTNELRLAAERAGISKEYLNKINKGDRNLSGKEGSKAQAFAEELVIIKRTRKA